MEKRNVAEPKRTPCSFCGQPSVTFVGERAACKLHVEHVKSGSAETPLKDAASGLTEKWADK